MALAALDPRIVHSFRVGEHLMVVSTFEAAEGLPGLTVGEVRERFGGLALALRRAGGGDEVLHPGHAVALGRGDIVTLQATYGDYLRLRAFTREAAPPVSLLHPAPPPGRG
jgi:voltage-gated potassium channel